MAAHLYWRLNISQIDGGTVLTVAEIQLRATVGGASVATGGTATASSATGGAAANAFDGSTATNWAAAAGVTAAWIQYQFATAKDIVEVAVTAPSATMTNAPKNWVLQYSDDGLDWRTAAVVTGQTGWTASQQRVFTNTAYPPTIAQAAREGQSANNGGHSDGGVERGLATLGGGRVFTGPLRLLSGIVQEAGVPVRRRVRACRRDTGELLNETWSDATTGAFAFNTAGYPGEVYVIALDDTGTAPDYNALIFDRVLPV